jgi:hypothetical protein
MSATGTEDQRRADERQRVDGTHAVQLRRENSREPQRSEQPDSQADADAAHRFTDHEAEHIPALRA